MDLTSYLLTFLLKNSRESLSHVPKIEGCVIKNILIIIFSFLLRLWSLGRVCLTCLSHLTLTRALWGCSTLYMNTVRLGDISGHLPCWPDSHQGVEARIQSAREFALGPVIQTGMCACCFFLELHHLASRSSPKQRMPRDALRMVLMLCVKQTRATFIIFHKCSY